MYHMPKLRRRSQVDTSSSPGVYLLCPDVLMGHITGCRSPEPCRGRPGTWVHRTGRRPSLKPLTGHLPPADQPSEHHTIIIAPHRHELGPDSPQHLHCTARIIQTSTCVPGRPGKDDCRAARHEVVRSYVRHGRRTQRAATVSCAAQQQHDRMQCNRTDAVLLQKPAHSCRR